MLDRTMTLAIVTPTIKDNGFFFLEDPPACPSTTSRKKRGYAHYNKLNWMKLIVFTTSAA
jgi:hypothetical protein